MLGSIEDGITSRIRTKLASAAGHLDVQKGTEGVPQPAVYVAVESGKFTKVSSKIHAVEAGVFVDIVFSDMQSESQRRKGIYPILQGVILSLTGQSLGLEIAPLRPVSFQNVTTREYSDKGLIVYELEMATKFNMEIESDEAVTDLYEIGLNYYLKPGDETADAADEVRLAET
jgi:hypothetical protein